MTRNWAQLCFCWFQIWSLAWWMWEFFVRILGLGSALRKVQPEASGHSAHIVNISAASQVKYSLLFFSPRLQHYQVLKSHPGSRSSQAKLSVPVFHWQLWLPNWERQKGGQIWHGNTRYSGNIKWKHYFISIPKKDITLSNPAKHIIYKLLFCSDTDLAPGNDEIYEEKQETFLTAGNPQDGQVVLYKVSKTKASLWCESQLITPDKCHCCLTLLNQQTLSG